MTPRTRRSIVRAMSVVLFIPGGLICFAFPFLLVFAGDLGQQLLNDTKGMLGEGTPTGVTIHQVACYGSHYGTNRRGSSTEYSCTLFLTGASQDRIERTCIADRTGQIPTIRLLAQNPDRYAVSWGTRELAGRYLFVAGLPALGFFAFGFACFCVTYLAWTKRV